MNNRSEFIVGDVSKYYARLEPNKVALYDQNLKLTYAELDSAVAILAGSLKRLGVKPSDVVCAYLPNCIEYVLVVLAVARIGAIFSPINPRYKTYEVSTIFDQAKPVLVFTDQEHYETTAKALKTSNSYQPNIVLIDNSDVKKISFLSLLNSSSEKIFENNCIENDYFSLMFTSGTTGKPKGVLSTHRARMVWVLNAAIQYQLNSSDIYLGTMPQVHSAGLTFTLMHLYVGATVRIMPNFDPEQYVYIVENESITSSLTVPTILTMVLEHLDKKQKTLTATNLRRVVTCGSPLPFSVKQRVLNTITTELFDYYGSTESNSMTVLRPADQLRKPTSVGQSFRNVKLKIVDKKGKNCPVGVTGEILCMNPSVMSGYLNRKNDTKRVFVDGWFRTGDVGYLDQDDFLHLTGRINDVIISGGVNIYPAEIEQVLISHPLIIDAAVVGVNDPKWGQIIKAYVVTRDNQVITLHELQEFCTQFIADFKKPRIIELRTHLPKNAGGKTIKSALIENEHV